MRVRVRTRVGANPGLGSTRALTWELPRPHSPKPTRVVTGAGRSSASASRSHAMSLPLCARCDTQSVRSDLVRLGSGSGSGYSRGIEPTPTPNSNPNPNPNPNPDPDPNPNPNPNPNRTSG